MTINRNERLGQALLELATHLRFVLTFYNALERHLSPEDPLVKQAQLMLNLGQHAYDNLLAGLVEVGLLDSGPELPEPPPEPKRVLQ